ncbi:exodeoxyribonuclease V subunit alpha [Salinisphaera orenii MK-B5]|uniref:RecBCD enzyme subunit RecD n=1 Tax=Salinisphaera orenii MK-B5 TaxID=856730 RepID=A0A423PY30_9GAMM|nr:exodeoxyribonuclease V subunit alpha [Salinisphaera orenii]ROO30486.1 exodeoxyribonuclease V subunit alpha [Salinisphaera orenii MK-B5]
MNESHTGDLFESQPATPETTRRGAPNAAPQPETLALAEDANLSDLDLALAHWARRHGADRLVARAFALASWAVAQGHTCLALDQIPTALMSAANQAALPDALAASELVTVLDGETNEDDMPTRPLILEAGRLYLQRYHAYETKLAERLSALMAAEPNPVNVDALKPGNGLFAPDAANPNATNWQAVAAFAALRHHFTVISGGPGTGKTYTIVRLLRVLIEAAIDNGDTPPLIALAAPTGKAAARMLESVRNGLDDMGADTNFDKQRVEAHIPQTARTLHRLLGLTGATTRARFNADNPLPYDVVIVDEASMVDLPMMAKLADAIRDDARLILLGDRYQLASVESGSVLAEICANAGVNRFTAGQHAAAGELLAQPVQPADHALADHVVTLQTSRRFNADSTIGRLAAAVNAGDVEAAQDLLNADHDDLVYHDRSDAVAIGRLMDQLAGDYASLCEATDPSLALAQLGKQCVLTAVRKGTAGSETINAGITERLARRCDFNPRDAWYHGRPVMVRRNDYKTGLYNGDVGIALLNRDGQLRVWFEGDNGLRAFLPSALPAHDSVYAMTIHKSQGSEFDSVTLVLPDYDVPVLARELFYTGLTRGRARLAVYAGSAVLARTVERQVSRVSGLANRTSATASNDQISGAGMHDARPHSY